MEKSFLIITSIASDKHPVLQTYARQCGENNTGFILIGDTKSPENFSLPGCDYYSVKRQPEIDSKLAELIPFRHYSRKNLGYLKAISLGAEIIIETDDDNLPGKSFWEPRQAIRKAWKADANDWVNVYRYFSDEIIWPRGLPLDAIHNELPALKNRTEAFFPIQQGLADGNPDVDAAYRLMVPESRIEFADQTIALQSGSWCPFNSQNTTWFPETFPLLYLPSYCSFRMTDIWRSFVAQRIAWSCGWNILFHGANVFQERNEHNLMKDFEDEIPGYLNNRMIAQRLEALKLKPGPSHITENLLSCYRELISVGVVGKDEMPVLEQWVKFFS